MLQPEPVANLISEKWRDIVQVNVPLNTLLVVSQKIFPANHMTRTCKPNIIIFDYNHLTRTYNQCQVLIITRT